MNIFIGNAPFALVKGAFLCYDTIVSNYGDVVF